jgi:Cu-Zn family superoxide dismutase
MVLALALAAGCGKDDDNKGAADKADKAEPAAPKKEEAAPKKPVGPPPLEAAIKGLGENADISGLVTVKEYKGAVTLLIDFEKMPPGLHGMQITQNGDCSADDGSSAGDAFNPTESQHGHPEREPHQAGDMGNVAIGADGKGQKKIDSTEITVKEGADNSIVGKGFVVYENKLDFKTHPDGAAGARIACGVFEQKPE